MIQVAKLCLWPHNFQSFIPPCSKGDLHKICDTQVVLDKQRRSHLWTVGQVTSILLKLVVSLYLLINSNKVCSKVVQQVLDLKQSILQVSCLVANFEQWLGNIHIDTCCFWASSVHEDNQHNAGCIESSLISCNLRLSLRLLPLGWTWL